jgi:hypothetical protein
MLHLHGQPVIPFSYFVLLCRFGRVPPEKPAMFSEMMLPVRFKLSRAVQFAAEVVFCKGAHKLLVVGFIGHFQQPCANKRQKIVDGPL